MCSGQTLFFDTKAQRLNVVGKEAHMCRSLFLKSNYLPVPDIEYWIPGGEALPNSEEQKGVPFLYFFARLRLLFWENKKI